MLARLDLDRIYRGYGFPNDMLVHLNVWSARVRGTPRQLSRHFANPPRD